MIVFECFWISKLCLIELMTEVLIAEVRLTTLALLLTRRSLLKTLPGLRN
jgi:hypothetical protein